MHLLFSKANAGCDKQVFQMKVLSESADARFCRRVTAKNK